MNRKAKFFLVLLSFALLVGTIAYGSQRASTWETRKKNEGGYPKAPWCTVYTFQIVNPATADTNGIHTLYNAYPAGVDTTYTFTAGEKAAFAVESAKAPGGRSLVVTTCDINGSNNNGIDAVIITVAGTNAAGDVIESTFTPTDNTAGAATQTSTTAFKTITSVTALKMADSGARFSIGFGNAYGMPYTSPDNVVLQACVSGVRETTFPTVTYSGTDLELNTLDFNTDANGSRDFTVYAIWTPYSSITSATADKW